MKHTKPKTSKYTYKPYKCEGCGHEFGTGTNHWGAIYTACPQCGNRDASVSRCMEPCPDTHELPEEWRIVKLGDVCKITTK